MARVERVIAGGEDANIKSEIEWLERAWQRAFGNELLAKYNELLNALTAEERRERTEAINTYRTQYAGRVNEIGRKPDEAKGVALAKELEPLARKLEGLGEFWYASEIYLFAGFFIDPVRAPSQGSEELAVKAYRRFWTSANSWA